MAQMRNYLFRSRQDFVANGTFDPEYVRGYGIIDALGALDGDCNQNGQDDALDISGGALAACTLLWVDARTQGGPRNAAQGGRRAVEQLIQ